MVDVCKRALVEGRVQGVWFRGSTQQQARRLGIGGWVRNLPDGRVEVLMSGDDVSVSELEQWLHQGPPLAKVTGVYVAEEAFQDFADFTTG